MEVNRYFETALKLVNEAGELIREAIQKKKNVAEKNSIFDLVTETDKAVEDLLIKGLSSAYPDHEFIGEESVAANGKIEKFSSKPTWIIDPIDGTMNFVHSNPLVTISVALAIDKKLVLGIIAAPCIGQTFTAIHGQGSKLNDKPIKVSDCTKLKLAQCIFEVWPDMKEEIQNHNFATIVKNVHSMRCYGSAALNLAFVAAGYADIYCQVGPHVWDYAAGAIIVKEAGGVVKDHKGQVLDLMNRGVLVASNEELLNDWLMKVEYEHEAFKRDHEDSLIF